VTRNLGYAVSTGNSYGVTRNLGGAVSIGNSYGVNGESRRCGFYRLDTPTETRDLGGAVSIDWTLLRS
jgi:hypothetical protein